MTEHERPSMHEATLPCGGRRRFLAAAVAGGALAASGCQTVALPDFGFGNKAGTPSGE